MKTIKLPYQTSNESIEIIGEIQRIQSSMIRFIYKRLKEGLKRKEITDLVKSKFNLDSWFIQSSYISKLKVYFLQIIKRKTILIYGVVRKILN